MKTMLTTAMGMLLAAGVMLAAACGGDDKTGKTGSVPNDAGGGASTEKIPEVIFLSGIPDSSTKALQERFSTVMDYLAKETGYKYEYYKVQDYKQFQDAFHAGKIHAAFFGGVTGVETMDDPANKFGSEILATRDIDLKFKSYFIANEKHVGTGDGKIAACNDWSKTKELTAFLTGKSFTFGSQKSTSGHVMPRHHLKLLGFKPEGTCKEVGYNSAGHDAVIKAVAGGTVDAGVCNYTNYEKQDAATKAAAPVISVTPEYVDYVWMANKALPKTAIEKIRAALLKLDGSKEEDRKVLDVTGNAPGVQQRFVAATPEQWDPIRQVLNGMKTTK